MKKIIHSAVSHGVIYSIRLQMFVAFDFYTKFDYLF
jgi:hypothetical protein